MLHSSVLEQKVKKSLTLDILSKAHGVNRRKDPLCWVVVIKTEWGH